MKRIAVVLITLICFNTLFAQGVDVHFSQYQASPLNLNPAFAGLNLCRYRVNANMKMQYGRSASSFPFVYNTGSVGFDMSIAHGYKYKNFAGFGVNYYSDVSGDLNFGLHKLELTLAYHILLNKYANNTLSFAVTGGFGYQGFTASKATFDSQYGEYGWDPNGQREAFDRTRFIYGDVGASALWSITTRHKNNYYLGLSTAHLNQPNNVFFTEDPSRLFLKFTAHGGAAVKIRGKFSALPSFMFLHQGAANELNIGTYVRYQLGYLPTDRTSIFLGFYARINNQFDAFIPAIRFDYKGLSAGFSWDINLSKFSPATGTIGGPELSLIYSGCFKKGSKVIFCPQL